MMNPDKEEQILRRRMLDLANNAYSRGICLFTDFLNLNEQNIFIHLKKEMPRIEYFTYGGFCDAERKILCFCGNDLIVQPDDIDFPISCIKVEPLNHKFSDNFNHRDFLGSILGLGIDRCKLGDILIHENEGFVFAHNSISSFIAEQLTKVKHTMVSAAIIEQKDFDYKPKFQEITGTVSSIRLDSILSVAFHCSRSSITGLIEGGKVFVGGKVILSNSYSLKEDDVVSVRGLGKFVYAGTSYLTKKGRYSVKILLYA
ncbi:MAG: YlmH/Sll1252 family protein [Herbinix sp.]|nr:YlmH/Sll1252 family protein [Herbinix sp.]